MNGITTFRVDTRNTCSWHFLHGKGRDEVVVQIVLGSDANGFRAGVVYVDGLSQVFPEVGRGFAWQFRK